VVGSRHVMRKGRLAVEPGAVRLIVHDPIPPPDLEGPPTPREAKALAGRVRAIVEATLDVEDPERPRRPPVPGLPAEAETGETAGTGAPQDGGAA
jgi:1-acyl-sn-glycerol-3-phosphate acyltransferase